LKGRRERGSRGEARVRDLGAALVVVAVLGGGATALADEPLGVVVVAASEQEPIVARVEQELRALGFVVTFSSTTDADSAALARASHASAVLRVATQPLEIRVWIAARKRAGGPGGESEPAPRDFKIDAPGDKSDPAVVALGAVELLHGALLPIDARAHEPNAPPIAPPIVAARPAADAAPRRAAERGPFAFQLGGGVSISGGGVPGAPVVLAGASWASGHVVDLALFALLPAAPGTVATNDGSIHVRVGGGGADLGASLVLERRLEVYGAVGAGLLVTTVDGEPRAGTGTAAASGSSASFFPHVRSAAALRTLPWLSIRGDVLAGLVTPEPVVRSLNRPVARVGQPELAFVASLEARP
jgi:hypothetical protein